MRGKTRAGTTGSEVRGTRDTAANRPRTVAAAGAVVALAAAACGHDWSSAADAPADLADATAEDGVVETADTDAEDVGPEDASPVGCLTDADCRDEDEGPCSDVFCDPERHICTGRPFPDDTPCRIPGLDGICCGGACVEPTDVAHCGSCAGACTGGPRGEPICVDGRCALRCEAGWLDCAAEPGCETESLGDERFCGACDRRCEAGQTCLAGACVPSWTPTSTARPPRPRRQAVGFWTGSQMIVWGGHSGSSCFRDGGRYDPATDSWQGMADPPLQVRGCHRSAAVWADTEMIVWSGVTSIADATPEDGGGRYDPTTDSWSYLPLPGSVLTPRVSPAAVWTGSQMVVWSGLGSRDDVSSSGARYDRSSDAWVPMTNIGAPPGSWSAAAVWTGSWMIVWGGWADRAGSVLRSGGRYDPSADRWYSMNTTHAPSARGEARAVWTGREMLVWGGAASRETGGNPGSPLGDGGAYDPVVDSWRPLGSAGAPTARFQNAAAWSGSQMIVWGGTSDATTPAFGDGALYDPGLDTWIPITNDGAPSARRAPSSVWTGELFVVWGGCSYDPVDASTINTDTGGRYRPR